MEEEDGESRRFPFNYNEASGSTCSLINKILRTTAEPTGCLFTSQPARKQWKENKRAPDSFVSDILIILSSPLVEVMPISFTCHKNKPSKMFIDKTAVLQNYEFYPNYCMHKL